MTERTFKSIRNRLRYQLRSGLYYVPWVLLLLAFTIAPLYFQATEFSFRACGTALQLIGVGSVALGIKRTRKDLGDANILEQLRRWASFPKTITADFTGVIEFGDTLSAVGHVSNPEPNNNSSIAEVTAWVKQQISAAATVLKEENAELKRNIDRLDHELAAETNRASELKRQIEKLQKSTTSGLNLSAYGVICLAIGIIYGTLPPDLRGLFGG